MDDIEPVEIPDPAKVPLTALLESNSGEGFVLGSIEFPTNIETGPVIHATDQNSCHLQLHFNTLGAMDPIQNIAGFVELKFAFVYWADIPSEVKRIEHHVSEFSRINIPRKLPAHDECCSVLNNKGNFILQTSVGWVGKFRVDDQDEGRVSGVDEFDGFIGSFDDRQANCLSDPEEEFAMTALDGVAFGLRSELDSQDF